MAEPKVGNIRVLVLYPSGEGKRFDSEYWLTTHYGLLKKMGCGRMRSILNSA